MTADVLVLPTPRRPKGIGASQVGAILGIHPYCRAQEIWEELTGKKPPFEGNWDTTMGQALEPVIAQEYARRNGGVLLTKSVTVQHPDHPWAFATPDYEHGGVLVEIKNVRFKGKKGGDRDMRPVYEAQVRWQLACRGLEKGIVFIHCMSKGRDDPELFESLEVTRRLDLESAMFAVCERFWRFVESDTPPPPAFPLEEQ